MTALASQNATALVALMKLKGVGRRAALRIVDTPADQSDPEKFRAMVIARAELARIPGEDVLSAWSQSEAQIRESFDAGVHAYAIHDADYPERLRDIPDPPAVLFVKGSMEALRVDRAIAVIGTREPTSYGARVARKSAAAAARAGFVIVSGLAHGCDTFGHEGCLDADGLGVAVLAHGLDRIYPAANRGLAERLLEAGGCLVSEYPIGFTPMRTAFAERDRIQSGLSDGVLVIETDVKGGTMHTVRFAGEQHRQLACIEHPEQLLGEDKTKGNQMLIAEGRALPIPDGAALDRFLADLHPEGAPEPPLIPDPTPPQGAWDF